jgi:hypothetical protein
MGWSGRFLSSHRDLNGIAPHAHLRIAHAVDGAVFPLGRRGGEGKGVGVVGRGVVGEEDEAFAVAAVHLELEHVEEGAEALPAPADEDGVALERGARMGWMVARSGAPCTEMGCRKGILRSSISMRLKLQPHPAMAQRCAAVIAACPAVIPACP